MKRAVRILIGVAVAVLMAIGCLAAVVHLAPERVLRYALDVDRERAGLVAKRAELDGGVAYAYLEGGKGEPLILLHGFGANKDSFTRAARYLTPHYRVVIPDLIGFGESSRPPGADYSPAAQAARLHQFALALGIKRVHLGGNSMGGHIALAYAALHSTEVASLWLLDPGGVRSAPPSELAREAVATGRNRLLVQDENDFVELFAMTMHRPPFIPRPILRALAEERIANYELERAILAQVAADSIEARVTGLATPALIVWGEEDRMLRVEAAHILHKLLPNSHVVIMPGVGHLPMVEYPKASADEYLRFRAGLK
ncbi:MAG: alpha/beta hydrolase [Betaproteobacteria bacterium]